MCQEKLLLPTPYSPFPAPCSLLPTPCSPFPAPYSLLLVLNFKLLTRIIRIDKPKIKKASQD